MNANKKGKNAEKDLCRFLQVWVGFSFKKTDRSGADRNYEYQSFGLGDSYLGAKDEYIVSNVGDSVPTNDLNYFGFVLESKHYKSLFTIGYSKKLKKVISATSTIRKFWDECMADCERLNSVARLYGIKDRLPLVFLRENGMRKIEFKGHKVQSYHVCLPPVFYPANDRNLYDLVLRECNDPETNKLLFFTIHSRDLPKFIEIEDFIIRAKRVQEVEDV